MINADFPDFLVISISRIFSIRVVRLAKFKRNLIRHHKNVPLSCSVAVLSAVVS